MTNLFIPNSIYIKNFNNITEMSVAIPEILVITGKNGSGKSSVIDAFYYCITGQTLRDVQIDDIIRKGEKYATITITGTYNDEPIEITRTRKSSGQKLSVLVGENKTPAPSPKEFLDGIVTPSEFTNLFLVDGHNLARFSSVGAKEMSANIDKVLNFGKLDSMIKELGQSISRFDKDVKVMEAKADTLQAKKDASEKTAKLTGRDVFESRIALANEQLPSLREQEKELSSKVSELQKNIKAFSSSREGIKTEKDREMRITREIEGIAEKLSAFDHLVSNAMEELQAIGGESMIATIDADIAKLRQTIATAEAEFAMRKDFPALIKKAMDAAPDGTDCPMCATPGARAAAEENFNTIVTSNKDVLSSLLTTKVKAQKEIAVKDEIRKKVVTLQSVVTVNGDKVASLTRDRDEKNRELEGVVARLAEMDSSDTSYDLEAAEKELSLLSGSMAKITSTIQTLTRDAGDARRSLDEIDKTPIDTWSAEKETELAGLRSESSRVTIKIEKMSVLRSVCQDALSNIRERIMNTLTPGVMNCIKNFGMGESAITKFAVVPRAPRTSRSKAAKAAKDEPAYYYDFAVEVAGNDVPFDSLSTGQKALVILSFILSMINYSGCSLSCMFFDEIDSSGLDRNYIHTIVKAIVTMSESIKVVFVDRDRTTIDALASAGEKKGLTVPVIEMPDPSPRA